MKILGVTFQNEEDKLLSFALSLFDNVQTKIQTFYTLSANDFSTPTALVVLSISIDDVDIEQLNKVLRNIKTPIFLLCHSMNSFVSDKQRAKILASFSANEVLAWDTFEMSNLCNSLDAILGISDIPKRIELCRKVNEIQYSKLKLKDTSKTSCGIDRDDLECGDESDY